jgi:two-component system, OmpR family, alkaline phosphatase synthesis response regulator PhoP
MAKETIVVVDDERDILELLEFNLVKNGYRTLLAVSGEEALRLARERQPDLILLDVMLPAIDGLDVCKILKNEARTANIPVVMVSAKGEEADVVTGLELGADDYITKPFSPRILLARVKAVLRKPAQETPAESAIIKRGYMVLDPGRREVTVGPERVELTCTEFGILQFLMRRPGWVFTRNQIIDAVRGDDYAVTERAVDVQIVNLRRKLGEAGNAIDTVRGVGYRFKE